jgi:hypothetical protein
MDYSSTTITDFFNLCVKKVIARPVGKSGKYQTIAIDINDQEYVLKKAGALKSWVNFYRTPVNGNSRDNIGSHCTFNNSSNPNCYFRNEWIGSFGVAVEGQ